MKEKKANDLLSIFNRNQENSHNKKNLFKLQKHSVKNKSIPIIPQDDHQAKAAKLEKVKNEMIELSNSNSSEMIDTNKRKTVHQFKKQGPLSINNNQVVTKEDNQTDGSARSSYSNSQRDLSNSIDFNHQPFKLNN